MTLIFASIAILYFSLPSMHNLTASSCIILKAAQIVQMETDTFCLQKKISMIQEFL